MTFCEACQASPKHGYCSMPECPKLSALKDAIQTFMDDYRKGDFGLSRLAALDAEAIEQTLADLRSHEEST